MTAWTDPEIAFVAEAWAGCHSAGKIANRMGRTTNSVIGIINRRKMKRGKPAPMPQPPKMPPAVTPSGGTISVRQHVIRVLRSVNEIGPATADEIAQHIGRSRHTVSPLARDACRLGLLDYRTIEIPSGGFGHAYTINAAGIASMNAPPAPAVIRTKAAPVQRTTRPCMCCGGLIYDEGPAVRMCRPCGGVGVTPSAADVRESERAA